MCLAWCFTCQDINYAFFTSGFGLQKNTSVQLLHGSKRIDSLSTSFASISIVDQNGHFSTTTDNIHVRARGIMIRCTTTQPTTSRPPSVCLECDEQQGFPLEIMSMEEQRAP